MKPKIYLAGPISGLTYKEATDWRKYAESWLSDVFQVLDPLRGKEYLRNETDLAANGYPDKPLSTGKAIVGRDRNDVKTSAVVLMNMLGAKIVSTGTVLELGWADVYETPVVLVMEPTGNVHEHAMVRELAAFHTGDLNTGIDIARYVIGAKARATLPRLPGYNPIPNLQQAIQRASTFSHPCTCRRPVYNHFPEAGPCIVCGGQVPKAA